MSKPTKAAINQKSVAEVLRTYDKLLDLLFRLKENSPEFRLALVKSSIGNKLSDLLRGQQRYVWAKVGEAEHLYPVYTDHRKVESVAYVAEDSDFVKRNKKDTRFSWRVLGRAGTDQNGWCKNKTQAKQNCEKYFDVKPNT